MSSLSNLVGKYVGDIRHLNYVISYFILSDRSEYLVLLNERGEYSLYEEFSSKIIDSPNKSKIPGIHFNPRFVDLVSGFYDNFSITEARYFITKCIDFSIESAKRLQYNIILSIFKDKEEETNIRGINEYTLKLGYATKYYRSIESHIKFVDLDGKVKELRG